jgi:hypothetical protein
VPPYGPSEETCSKAYDLWCQNYSFRHIWLMLSGPPHNCKSKTSAIAWVKRGRDLETLRGTSLGRRRALRERHAVELRRQYQQIEQEIEAGLLPRPEGRKLQLKIMDQLERLLGLPAAPEPRKGKIEGGGFQVGSPDDLRGDLSAVPAEEVLAHLPDETLRRLGLERKAPHDDEHPG